MRTERRTATWLAGAAGVFLALCSISPGQGVSGGGTTVAPLIATAPITPTSLRPDLSAPAAPDTFVLGQNDLVSVFVYEMPEFTRQARVDNRGEIKLPFLPTAIRAQGRTPPELAAAVAQSLESAGLARMPQVQVTVVQVESRPVVISGEVRNPGVLQAVRPMTLGEALARAGGLTPQAGGSITVSQPAGADGKKPQLIRVSVQAVLDPRNPPIWLHGGETVQVAPDKMVFAVGALVQPGGFPLENGERMTALRVVALAHGFASHADSGHAVILNEDSKQPPRVIDLTAVAKGKIPDPVLAPGEVVYVPDNTRAKGLAAVLTDAGQALTLAIAYGR